MHTSDQKHMWEDGIDHPRGLIVSSKSKRAALVNTDDGNSVFVTGDFSDSMTDLEDDVRKKMKSWPFDRR